MYIFCRLWPWVYVTYFQYHHHRLKLTILSFCMYNLRWLGMCKSSFHSSWGKSINGLGFNPLGRYTKYVCKIVSKVICVLCTMVLHDPHKTF